MENQFKSTYSKIKIDDSRRTEMETVIGSKKNKNAIWIRSSLAVAGLIAVLFIIPATRTQIVNAATNLIRVFTAGGQEITVEQHSDESVVSIDYDENKSYSLVENGRLYLVVGDVKIDVTNQCSDTEYYRYEIVNNDGSRNVIFIGGTINNPGWVELIFDASGNYVTNHMCIAGYDPCIWQEQAMHNEGVPCGNWDLDKELYE